MPNVRLKTSLAGARESYAAGQILQVSKEVAESWIKRGIAVDTENDEPEIRVFRAPERTAKRTGKSGKGVKG